MKTEQQFIKAANQLSFKVEELFIDGDNLNVCYSYHYMYNLFVTPPFENEWKYSKQSLVGKDYQDLYNQMSEIANDELFVNFLTIKPILFYER